MQGLLEGKVAVITGAGSGVGRAAVKLWTEHGAKVIAADINLANAEESVRLAGARQGQAKAVECNVADPASVDAAVAAAVESFGRLDIIYNNAGITISPMPGKGLRSLVECEPDEMKRVEDVNINGVIYGCQAAIRQFDAGRRRERGGVIVNTASVAGHDRLWRGALRRDQGRGGQPHPHAGDRGRRQGHPRQLGLPGGHADPLCRASTRTAEHRDKILDSMGKAHPLGRSIDPARHRRRRRCSSRSDLASQHHRRQPAGRRRAHRRPQGRRLSHGYLSNGIRELERARFADDRTIRAMRRCSMSTARPPTSASTGTRDYTEDMNRLREAAPVHKGSLRELLGVPEMPFCDGPKRESYTFFSYRACEIGFRENLIFSSEGYNESPGVRDHRHDHPVDGRQAAQAPALGRAAAVQAAQGARLVEQALDRGDRRRAARPAGRPRRPPTSTPSFAPACRWRRSPARSGLRARTCIEFRYQLDRATFGAAQPPARGSGGVARMGRPDACATSSPRTCANPGDNIIAGLLENEIIDEDGASAQADRGRAVRLLQAGDLRRRRHHLAAARHHHRRADEPLSLLGSLPRRTARWSSRRSRKACAGGRPIRCSRASASRIPRSRA